MLKSRINRLASWLALVAVVFASLAPTISRALPVEVSISFQQEVCDSQGVKHSVRVDFATENKSAPQQVPSAMHLEHCPYCAAHMSHVMAAKTPLIVFLSALNSVHRIDIYTPPVVQAYYPVSHPSHAPPLV